MTIFRDTGPYSARNSSKGALIAEAGKVIKGLRSGLSLDELRARALDGDLFSQRARATRKRIWALLYFRYLSQPDWVLSALQSAYGEGAHSQEFISLLYLHYALRDRLTYAFVTEILWEQWGNQQRSVVREDVLSLLDQASETQPQIQRWAESTRLKLAGSILTALRDFGVLEGRQKKTLIQPTLPLPTAEHLLRILTAEGLRGSEILRDFSWRLIFCEENDVAHVLSQLAQERRIHFERVGSTVVLDTPDEWSVVQ
jgi:hypothetical protein